MQFIDLLVYDFDGTLFDTQHDIALSVNLTLKELGLSQKDTNEIKISKLVAINLKQNDIYFAGIDFIDQKLNGDINVTSPTGLKTYYDLSKINLAKVFWKGLKA